MITDKEIQVFWSYWDQIIISWFCVSAFFVLSIILIPFTIIFDWYWAMWIYHAVIPINFLLKYGLRIKGLWFFNGTKDGDWGADWWLKREGLKPGVISAINWWFRNHSWGYISKFNPTCNSAKSQVSEYRVLFNSRDSINTVWLKKEEIGSFHICYRCNKTGRVYCRYSKVTKKVEKHFGAGGRRYKLHYKFN